MPIYEYQAVDPAVSCDHCLRPFEAIQGLKDRPLKKCPECGGRVRKIISWCRAAVMETSPEDARVTSEIRDHEQAGRFSHAAELADTHAAKTKDKALKTRALDNYAKAGYPTSTLNKHDSEP